MKNNIAIDLRREALKQEREKFERAFEWHWSRIEVAKPRLVRQALLIPDRQFRFDFAFPDAMVAVELDGGLYTDGGHSRGRAIEEQYLKRNSAARLGWCVLCYGTRRLEREMHLIVDEVLAVIQARSGDRE